MARYTKTLQLITVSFLVMTLLFSKALARGATMALNISSTINVNETALGSCTVVHKDRYDLSNICSKMRIKIMRYNPDANTCHVNKVATKVWMVSGCKIDFTILCSKSNIKIDLQCMLSSDRKSNTIQIIPKPEIITRPINTTVKKVGQPITLTCTVSGDPSHYWIGWVYQNSIIQRGDGNSHSLSTSPSLMPPNGTTHYLTVHYVNVPGKYTCQVYSIEGEQLDHVTHQVSIKEDKLESSSSSSLFDILFSRFFT